MKVSGLLGRLAVGMTLLALPMTAAATTTVTNNGVKQVKPATYDETGYADGYNSVTHSFTDDSSGTYSTYLYLPSYFSTADTHRGNYQGGVQIGTNLYLVESYNDNNNGNLVKIDLKAFHELGLDTAGKQGELAMAYDYFDPTTTEGQAHQAEFDQSNAALKAVLAKIAANNKQLTKNNATLTKRNGYIANETKWLKYWQKAQKTAQTKVTALTKTIKADQKQATNRRYRSATRRKYQKLVKKYQKQLTTAKKRVTKSKAKIKSWQAKKTAQQKLVKTLKATIKTEQATNQTLLAQEKNTTGSQTVAAYYAKIKAVAVAGPTISTGHGQALGYDSKHNRLFLYSSNATNPQLQLVDQADLTTSTTYSVDSSHHPGVLTFDTSGHAYYGFFSGTSYRLYQGTYEKNVLTFKLKAIINNQTTDVNQNLAYDAYNGRLYLLGDDSLTSLPLAKLNDETLTDADLHNITFNTTKEFENISFDASGYGYITVLRSPEILKSSSPMN
ncbi:coiled-coil domain-containing protein [Lactiplantibacillus daowaiensis]|uniref:Coiled-coil domain-containing protein n=1 Tax=Lactiplantibacillus daowaiensis TaxID=2559918 RepID=A0ABW1S4A2_9LACO|nr:hypothetical protein [Lactiplantibacillus daowaiensis]